ncbi:WD40/YVTN/BNR-like repeat-containing protein [Anaerotignum sp.]|uniref:WD40/YVTN/BNR-like repeat-containing protein n=1 Tax=Anaerotignum sp. TaxID=2039241 RepID=UPI00289C70E6|nr:sialidase family protein [Anaerotignum sp.]
MSIFSQLNNLILIKNAIKNKLYSFGLVTSSAKLEDCKNALSNMNDNTKKTTTSQAVRYSYYSGAGGTIYGTGIEGYNSAKTMVSISVTNLSPGNIRKGINIGGVIGTCEPMPSNMSFRVPGFRPQNSTALLGNNLFIPCYSKNTSFIGGVWKIDSSFKATNIFSNTTAVAIYKYSNTKALLRCTDGNNGSTDIFATTDGGSSWTNLNSSLPLYEPRSIYSNGSSYVIIGKRRSDSGSSGTIYKYSSIDGISWSSEPYNSPGFGLGGMSGDPSSGYYYSGDSFFESVDSRYNQHYITVYRSTDATSWSVECARIPIQQATTSSGFRFYFQSYHKLGNLRIMETNGDMHHTIYSTDNGVTWNRTVEFTTFVEYKSKIYCWSADSPTVVGILSSSGFTKVTLTTSTSPNGIAALSNKFVVLYNEGYEIMDDIY